MTKFQVTGVVCHGDEIGRTIGFPTANIIPKNLEGFPAVGVYIGTTIIDGKKYKSIINYGDKPTLNGREKIVESHILDFNQEIYDKEITIIFEEFVREQKKFENMNELKKQLIEDKTRAQK